MEHGDLVNYRRIVRHPFIPGQGYDREAIEITWKKLKHPYRFRMDPVPYIHKYGNGHYYRRVKTTNERKNWYASIDQGVFPRRRRGPRLLPDTWNDIPVSSYVCYSRSWKKVKKRKQWMR